MRNKLLTLIVSIVSISVIASNAVAMDKHDHSSHENKDHNNHQNMDHSKHNMSGMNHRKPTKEVTVNGVKATFYIVDLKHAKEMIGMVKGKNVFSGSMHPYVVSDKQDKCYICGMKLKKQAKNKVKLNEDKNSHHIEVYFTNTKTGEMYNDVEAKVKVIHPDKDSDEYTLKPNYGYFGSDINFHHNGKHGIITLFKINGKKRVAKLYFENTAFKGHHH